MNQKKIVKLTFVVLLLFVTLFGLTLSTANSSNAVLLKNHRSKLNSNTQSISKVETDLSISDFTKIQSLTNTIAINGNSQIVPFSSQGSGTKTDPYIYEGHNLANAGGIIFQISNTNAYFVIKNNVFNPENYASSIGVEIDNASNIQLLNNEFIDANVAVSATNATNLIIQGNNIHSKYFIGEGVSFSQVNNSIVSLNTISLNNGLSFLSSHSYYNNIKNNVITGVSTGIFFSGSFNNNIFNNTITNCTTYGIELKFGYNSIINSNNINMTGEEGIILFYSFNNTVIDNLIYGNPGYSIELQYSNNNSIISNIVDHARIDAISIHYTSDDNIIIKNTITNADTSIDMYLANSNTIAYNSIINTGFGTLGMYVDDSNLNSFYNNSIANATNDIIVTSSHWNSFVNMSLLSKSDASFSNGSMFLNSNYNTFMDSDFGSNFDFALVLFNGTGNRVIANSFNDSTYYSLFLYNEQGDVVQRNNFLGVGHFGGTQAFDNGIDNLFLNNYWNGITDYPVIIDGSTHSTDKDPLTSANGQPYSAKVKSKTSPGFEGFAIISAFVLIALLGILKRKNYF